MKAEKHLTTQKRGTFCVLIIIYFLTIIQSCSSRGENKKVEKNSDQTLEADVVILKNENIENNVFTTGTLISNEYIELKAPLAGMIMEIKLNEGERVKTGQKLVQLDDREWQAQLIRYQSQLKVAERVLSRNSALLEINGISQEMVDQSEGNVETLKANIAEIKVKIDQASVRAPFDGRVGLRNVSLGEFVTAGTSLISLVQGNPIKLDFSLPGKYANQLRTGQRVRFVVDGITDSLSAEVYAIEPRLDAESRTIQVRARADNSEGKLFPGAFANIKVTLDVIENAVLVPTEAVIPELNTQKVFVIENGKAVSKMVRLGIRSGKNVQITDGLQEGDTVMVTGLLQVRENFPVRAGSIINPQQF